MRASEQVRLRSAVAADAEALTELHLDCWDDAYAGLVPQPLLDARRHDVPARVERWRRILEEEHGTTVAETAVGLVGFVSAGPGRDNDVDTELELMALYVRSSHWGDGVGHRLLHHAIGDRAAYLWVLAGNDRAISFYRRHGFALDGTEDELDEGRHLRMVRAEAEGAPAS